MVELSVVMPCLNEADTLEACIREAREGIREAGVEGEIVIADNGSMDGSRAIARKMGARVVSVEKRGYGSALMGGIGAAEGNWVIMGDADQSYDFRETPRFVDRLREGYDLVQGCRMPRGGGTVRPGAMPFLHRWWGNPMFSFLARRWFGTPIHDIHCGMRAFRREFANGLGLRCTGMEFASEMVIKATLASARIAEVPITLRPDKRTSHEPHLRTFRDGWRHLRFFLMYSPRWLFAVPGSLLILLGTLGYGVGLAGARIAGTRFGVHTMLFATLSIIIGYQTILFGVFTKVYGVIQGFLQEDPVVRRLVDLATLERGLIAGAVLALIGMGLLGTAIGQWYAVGLGDLDYTQTMRWVIPGTLFLTLGTLSIFSSFFLSILGVGRE